jgi:hypothetical protein
MTMTKPKLTKTRKPVAKASYEAFVTAVLEPLSDHELIDTHYNGHVRQSRYDTWCRASSVTCYYRAAMDFYGAGASYYRTVEVNPTISDAWRNSRWEALAQWRLSVSKQILTPCYNRECVTWKLRAAKNNYLPISQEEIKAAIEADEAFLNAHPLKRLERLAAWPCFASATSPYGLECLAGCWLGFTGKVNTHDRISAKALPAANYGNTRATNRTCWQG